ncbi:multiple sugar transport system permease protein/alpha-1,4-digalacturonate transport system permease protein [Streptomyces sp. KhCrAH-43]|uniref:carbohydrate ABC transporter permease n=1 Tax=unclassified Streptomyces TaxID=2593676 RepID=UPI000365E867|nr:sugar ABC transporter permease [Streptomyces sp. KhCrAH-43]MYS36607.1 ABC transporter permease subunit [Streptomyces sp. SID4920]MYX69078.1 ABC transporter permease subunit [Streptomyces sp. SID8373]RAJ61933.1 multiple sugar transport system permease protein/alpha-1,4-digalacturonate transport system permease protein [Streptomyces sp. KhCrAH-43]
MTTLTSPPTGHGAPGASTAHRAAEKRRRRRTLLVGWSFILPNFLGFAALTLVPVVGALAISFTDWDSYSTPHWVGLDNFERLWNDSNFWAALRNTLFYAAGHIPLTLLASLGLAVLLNQKLRGVGLLRTAFFFPYVTSLVAVAVVWNMLLSPEEGPVNQFLMSLGISDPPGWTSSQDWAMPALIIASVWRDMGYYMVLFLAGLQAIPAELYEAARMDGAGPWQRFWHVTLPGLRPTTFFVTVMVTVSSFKVFDLVQVMTEGGPGRSTLVLSQLIFREGITQGRFGYASAVSLALFLICLVITVIQFRMQRRSER